MLELEENLRILKELLEKLNSLEETLNISSLKNELENLKNISSQDNFWDDKEKSNEVFGKIKRIERKLDRFTIIQNNLNSLIDMNKLLQLEYDEELGKDLINQTNILSTNIENLELETLLSGKYDGNNAILTLHPGAGGTESQDWVEMLYRMYTKWANSNGFEVKELDYLEGDEAGIKSVTFEISGENAYGYLQGEMGVHRLVRISPFDSGGRRHTSFASVEVLPEITDDIELVINSDDLRIDTYRASRSRSVNILIKQILLFV